MALGRPRLRTRRQQARPGKAWSLLLCAVAAAAAHRCIASLGFVAGAGRRAAPHASRVPRASRGGEASDSLHVGDKVQAVSPDDEQRYPGTIERSNEDGTFAVRWDDPDGGPETNDIAPADIKKIIIFRNYAVGDDVKAISADDGRWYPGTVSAINEDGSFQVRWDDPDGGPETSDAKPEDMKKMTVFKDYKADDAVEARYPDDGHMYPGTVIKANDDGTFQVKWDDADGGPEDSAVRAKDMRYPPIPVEKLETGQKFTGTVTSVLDFGAFVNIGATGDGLLHISNVADEHVENIRDYLEEGQEVEVWVRDTRDDGKFGLTMVESKIGGGGAPRRLADLSPFAAVSADEWLDGRVQKLAAFGAFVEVTLPDGGASASGLVHISKIRDGFIDSVEDELEVGQDVKVRIESVDTERKRLSLSMKEPAFGTGGGSDGAGAAAQEPVDLAPFESIAQDQWLTGTVARIAPFGAFVGVTAEDGTKADGLLHITQIRDGYVETVEDELEVGQEVQVRVLSVDAAAGRLSLSMKSEESGFGGGGGGAAPVDLAPFEGIAQDQWLTGTVARTAPFGAFVTVTAEDGTKADGLVHITQIKDGFVESVEDELEAGQEVQVRVVSVDPAAGKMGLSMKPE